MPTILLHRYQPYLAEHIATVVDMPRPNSVVLDQTAFFKRSGGQAEDHGTINSIQVTGLDNYNGGFVEHHLERPFGGQLGDQVAVAIDWQRRLRLMRAHGAQHLTFIALGMLYGLNSDLGGDIAPERARIDVAHRAGIQPAVDSQLVEAKVNELVGKDHVIERQERDDGSGHWTWAIDGVAKLPCGGTHVRSTGEIGPVRIGLKRKGSKALRVSASLIDGVDS